jgi:hypothetical protein
MVIGLSAAVFAVVVSLPPATIAAPEDVGGATGSAAGPVRSDLLSETLSPGHTSSEERDLRLGPRPRFIEPAATTVEHTRLGLSAWTVQGPPLERWNPGGVAMGFTIAWPPPRAESPSVPRP